MSSPNKPDLRLEKEDIVDISKINLQQDVEIQRLLESEVRGLEKRLGECQRGNPGNTKEFPNKFEEICFDMLKLGLKNEFTDCQIDKQVENRSEFGNIIEVTDIELQNNGRVEGTFWYIMHSDYQSERIVFECKNLTGSVDDHHIFQLYMYLGTRVGKFGIILTRNNCEKYNTKKGGLTESAFKTLRRLHADAGFMIWIWGEAEILSYLSHCKSNTVRQFFLDQKSLFMSKIR